MLVGFSYYLIIYPDISVVKFFGMMTEIDKKTGKEQYAIPMQFRVNMVEMTVINGLVAYSYEKLFCWWA